MSVITKLELRYHINCKVKYAKYPKLPKIVLTGDLDGLGNYIGSNHIVSSFLKRVKNWESNEMNNELSKLK